MVQRRSDIEMLGSQELLAHAERSSYQWLSLAVEPTFPQIAAGSIQQICSLSLLELMLLDQRLAG